MGTNAPTDVNPKLSDVKKALKEAIPKLQAIEADRKELNEDKREILSKLEEDHGLNRKAVQVAIAHSQLPDGQKAGFDLSYEITREAMGAAYQPDMLKPLEEPESKGPIGGDAPAQSAAAVH